MNILGYKLLVDKQLIRKITILSTLVKNNLSIPLEYLEVITKASRRTILQDISAFNHEAHTDMRINKNDEDILTMRCENPLIIPEYIERISKSSPLYQVIEFCYSGEHLSIGQLADVLFVSESSLKKYLSILKGVLKEFSLSLQLSPVEITGNENDIRFFYFQYFRYAHDSYNAPVRQDQTFAIYEIIRNIRDEAGVSLNVDYHRLSLWLSVFEQRVKLKRFTYISGKVVQKHLATPSYARFKKAFLLNFDTNEYLANIPESEIIYAFITRLDAILYEKGAAFFMEDFSDDHLKYDECISCFLKDNSLHIGAHSDLKLTLTAFLSNILLLSDLTPYFQRTNEELLQQVNHHYQFMQNQWISLFKKFKLDFIYPFELASKLTLVTIAYLQLHENKKNILFSFTGDPSVLMYYKSLAFRITPQGMNPIFIFNEPLNNTLIKKLDIDICVHNFVPQEKLDVQTAVKLSNIPQENDWGALLALLGQISLK
ncbi:helix-turn-helix domain-containing protein [Carnobacterium maltaromaticum]|uniref:helix-turn-helix domain-containing protein n=1 Tax=Carnobacterium maltaromaticum TaxID=2751 RepID=UPI0012F960BF|nr:helix-turn-helix domain-containing protein [Carnobacterium maltaromaticum]